MELDRSSGERDLLRFHLGDDWELLLILANAISGPDAADEEVFAAQQRAVACVRENSACWRDDLSDVVGEAWLTLWMEA